jgi:hypothetical protein
LQKPVTGQREQCERGRVLTVLGIKVSPALLERWVGWLAPDEQPFYVTRKQDAAEDPDRRRGEARHAHRRLAARTA